MGSWSGWIRLQLEVDAIVWGVCQRILQSQSIQTIVMDDCFVCRLKSTGGHSLLVLGNVFGGGYSDEQCSGSCQREKDPTHLSERARLSTHKVVTHDENPNAEIPCCRTTERVLAQFLSKYTLQILLNYHIIIDFAIKFAVATSETAPQSTPGVSWAVGGRGV